MSNLRHIAESQLAADRTAARLDLCGSRVTIANDTALASWNQTIECFLAHAAATPVHLSATIDADPKFTLGIASRGIMLLMLARSELVGTTRAALADAKASMADRRGDPVEPLFVNALEQWLDGAPLVAAGTLESALEHAPGHALAFKLAHAIRFMAGDRSGMLAAAERYAPAFSAGAPLGGYVMGCWAFALEEAGRYGEAEAVGRRAIKLAPRDAWGRHAIAHTMEMTGRFEDGAEFLSGDVESWAHCNNFGGHMFWHLALFLIELGRIPEVFALYDGAIRANRTDDFRDISNAASLLIRLELLGHDVGDRWIEMGEIASHRVADRQLVFADLHYLLALLRSGRGQASHSLVSALIGDGAKSHDSKVAALVGLRAAEGLVAFEAGDNDSAAIALGAVRNEILAVGGSNAQRDVFEQIFVESLVRAGKFDEAESVLSKRLAARGGRNAIAERLASRLGSRSKARFISLATAALTAA